MTILAHAQAPMRTLLTINCILFIAPVVASTALISYEPSRWGGELSPASILVGALFGLLSAPLWPTILLSVILTPVLMSRLSALKSYRELPYHVLLPIASATGAVAGVGVLSPVIWMASSETADLIWNWIYAGAAAGAVTAIPITVIYRNAWESGARVRLVQQPSA